MSREFWINQSRCTGIPVAYLSQESALEHTQQNDNTFKVREVDPAYDAAVALKDET